MAFWMTWRLKGSTAVCMARRSWGGVSITDMSRMPVNDMCSVLGMGVAVMVKVSTFFFNCLNLSL